MPKHPPSLSPRRRLAAVVLRLLTKRNPTPFKGSPSGERSAGAPRAATPAAAAQAEGAAVDDGAAVDVRILLAFADHVAAKIRGLASRRPARRSRRRIRRRAAPTRCSHSRAPLRSSPQSPASGAFVFGGTDKVPRAVGGVVVLDPVVVVEESAAGLRAAEAAVPAEANVFVLAREAAVDAAVLGVPARRPRLPRRHADGAQRVPEATEDGVEKCAELRQNCAAHARSVAHAVHEP